MTQNRYYSNLAQGTFITNSGGMTNTTTALIVQSTVKWPTQFPFTVRAEPGTTNEEVMLAVSGAGTAGLPYQVSRGFDNTNAIPHSSGVSVIPGFCQLDLSEPQQHINLSGSSSAAHGLPSSAWGGGTVQLLQTVAASGAGSTITFPSIPSTFSHLRVQIALQANGTGGSSENGVDTFGVILNGNTTSSCNWLGSSTSNGSSGVFINKGTITNGTPLGGVMWNTFFSSSSGFGWGYLDFPFYSVSGAYKGFLSQTNASDGGAFFNTFNVNASYQMNAPINQIGLIVGGSSTAWLRGNAWLYGIL